MQPNVELQEQAREIPWL